MAKRQAPAYSGPLAGIDPASISSRAALAALPVTRKSDLPGLQADDPPFGGFTAVAPGRLHRIFSSPGPIYDAEGPDPDYWRSARALHATGLRPGDVAHNCFSYHLTPAGVIFETGAHALGCAVGTGRHRQYGAAGPGHRRYPAAGLSGHAGLSKGDP